MPEFLTSPPLFADEDKTRTARLLFVIVWTFMVSMPLSLLIAIALPETTLRWLWVIAASETTGILLLVLNRRGFTKQASILLVVMLWAVNSAITFTGGGIHSNAVAVYLIIVFIAGLVLGGKAGIMTAAFCSATALALVLIEEAGILPARAVPHTAYTQWLAYTIYMVLIVGLQYLASQTIGKALQQSRRELAERRNAERALRESEEKYRLVVENAEEAILIAQDGMLRYLNPMTMRVLGYSEETLTTRPFVEIIHPEDREKVAAAHVRIMNNEEHLPVYQFRFLCRDGQVRWADSHAVVISWKGRPATLNFMNDITLRRRAEEEQRRDRETALRLAGEIAIIAEIGRLIGSTLAIDEVYEHVAAEARKLIPLDRLAVNLQSSRADTLYVAYVSGDAIPGRDPGDAFPAAGTLSEVVMRTRTGICITSTNRGEIVDRLPALIPTFQAGFLSLLGVPLVARDRVIGALHIRSKTADAYDEEDLRLAERIGVQIAGAVANARLFADLQRAEGEVREISLRDQLTGLYNRRGFITLAEQQLKSAHRNKSRLRLSFIDIDDMKGINDTLNHETGDRALIETAAILRRTFRESDIMARIGGDEFAVLALDVNESDPMNISCRLQQNIDAWNGKETRPYRLAMSWGHVVYHPASPVSLDQLMSEADRLMYAQKKAKSPG